MQKTGKIGFGRLFVLFPLLLPVWKETFFSDENIGIKDTPQFISDQSLQEQKSLFSKIEKPDLRSKMVLDFVAPENPRISEILAEMMQNEKDEDVMSDILAVILRKNGKYGDMPRLKACMQSENPRLRGLAAVFYLDGANSPDIVFTMLENEPIEYVRNLVWDKLAEKKSLYTEQKLMELSGKLPANQSVSLTRAIAGKTADPDTNPYLRKIAADGSVLEKAALAQSLAGRMSGGSGTLALLAENTDSRIRGCVAAACPAPDRLSTLVKLSEDKDYETRRKACISLGKYGSANDAAVQALIKRLPDEDRQVRDAAEQILVEIAIGEKHLGQISDRLGEGGPAVGPAIAVLGKMKFAPAATAIHETLKKTSDDEIRERAIYALGRLRHSPASSDIASLAPAPNQLVRKSVAFALGRINESSEYETLAKLSADPVVSVSTEAFDGIAATKNKFFCPAVMVGLKNVKESSDLRSAAARAAGHIEGVANETIKQLKANALDKIIPTDMGKVYDGDCPRASVAWALAEIARRNENVKPVYQAVAEKLMTPPDETPVDKEPVSSEYLVEFTRQSMKYFNGEECAPSELKAYPPNLSVSPLK